MIADLSVNHVERHVLLCGHVVERRLRDYGIDLVMQTFDADGEVEPGLVLLQLKATDHLPLAAAGRMIAQRLERRDLLAWLREPMPVILVVYDAQADKAYWVHVQGHFATRSRFNPRRGGDTLTVRLPTDNVLDRVAIQQFARLRDEVLARAPRRFSDE